MHLRVAAKWMGVCFALLARQAVLAQAPPASVEAALQRLGTRASVVFVGEVSRVDPRQDVVEVTWRVQRPVAGTTGATYTVREWAGLWSAGVQRYRVGQRAMVFLHRANSAGVSSPVDGLDGVVPMAGSSEGAAPLLDVSRLAARVARAQGAGLVLASNVKMSLATGMEAVLQRAAATHD